MLRSITSCFSIFGFIICSLDVADLLACDHKLVYIILFRKYGIVHIRMIAFQCMPRILKLVVMRLPHSPCSLKLLAVWVLLLSVDQYLNALVIVYTIHAVSLAQMASSRENTERYKTEGLPIIPHLAHNCKVWRLIWFSTSDCFHTVLCTHIYGTNFGSSSTIYFIQYILTL